MRKNNTVLYADDDMDDKNWLREACLALDSSLDIQFVNNGNEVIRYLESSTESDLPALIVLDLNMPELDGKQTLQKIKKNQQFKHIPVVIVTTSSNRLDKEVCQRLGADLYMTKPDTHLDWQHVIRSLEPYMKEA